MEKLSGEQPKNLTPEFKTAHISESAALSSEVEMCVLKIFYLSNPAGVFIVSGAEAEHIVYHNS